MIDPTVFQRAFAVLRQRFDREVSKPVTGLYYEILSGELSTEDFERACREVFRRDTFFPSPQRLIDAARGGSVEELAEQAWHEAVRTIHDGTARIDWEALPEAVKAGLRAVGTDRIFRASESAMPQLQRTFVRAYAAAGRPVASQVPVLGGDE